jgi:hypothetical protein
VKHFLPLFLLLSLTGLASGQDDWTRYRASARVDGAPTDTRVERAGDGYRLSLGADTFTVHPSNGQFVGESTQGVVGRLTDERATWRVALDAPREAEGRWLVAGVIRRGRVVAGAFTETAHRSVELILEPKASVPEHLVLEATDVGATEEEIVRELKPQRPDELTVVFLNVGKGEHVDHVPAVKLGGEAIDPLNANVRFLATLRPDFLVLAEVASGEGSRAATLDPGTRQVLRQALPGELLIPSIYEWPKNNNNAIFSRYRLSHVSGEDPKRCWEREAPPASEDHARVSTRYLDWTPRGLEADAAAAYRAEWGNNNYNTRAHSSIEFMLDGKECVLFPVHFAMPWLEVPRTAVRDGFLVDGLQDHQLHTRGPLYHQIERAREDYDRLTHGRVVVIGDTNIARHPKAAIPPLRIDPGTGDGRPERDTSLAFELLEQGFHDAFAGDDATWTWPNPATADTRTLLLPRQQIDNCLHGAGFEVVSRSVFFPRGADHGGLVVRLRLRDGESGSPRAPTPRAPRERSADETGPTLDVSAPERGALTDAPRVRVRGVVRDPAGLEVLWINGADVPVATDGAFEHSVDLAPGLNVIRLEARDAHGNRTHSVRSISRGELLDASQPVPSAAVVRLNRPVFAWAEFGVGTKLAAFDLGAALMAQNPLVDQRIASVKVRVTAKSGSFGSPSTSIRPTRGALAVTATVPSIKIELGLTADIRYGPTIRLSAKARVRRAVVSARAIPRVRDGKLETRLDGVRVRLDGFHIDVRHVPHFVDRFVSAQVRDLVAAELRKQVVAIVPPQIDRVLAIAQRPQSHAVAGRRVTLELLPERVAFDPRGVVVVLGANAASSTGVSLGTPGTLPVLTGRQALGVALDDDLLNRAAHVAWQLGLLDQHLTSASATAMGAPGWIETLNAGALAGLLPEHLNGVDPSAPLTLSVTPSAAPLLRPLPNGGLEVSLGDLLVTLAVQPPGEAPKPVLHAAVTCIARAKATLDDAGTLSIALTERPKLYTDVLDRSRKGLALEAIVDRLLPSAIESMVKATSGLAIPLPPEVRLGNVSISAAGPANDHVAVWATVPSPREVLMRASERALKGLPRFFGR